MFNLKLVSNKTQDRDDHKAKPIEIILPVDPANTNKASAQPEKAAPPVKEPVYYFQFR
jgi:hypothetical protein